MTHRGLAERTAELGADRVAFVTATVVRAQRPTSVRPGESAIVLGDGTIEGFVGGVCAESSVRLQALRVLETGEPLLLRIVPEGHPTDDEGALVVANPCLSGGSLEIFLEPHLPAPHVAVVGDTPIGFALAGLGEQVGFDVSVSAGTPDELGEAIALIVASHGRDEERALRAALEAGVPYVGLVASRERGAAVVEALEAAGTAAPALDRLRTPAGIAIGAHTPEEIAVSILAEIIASRRTTETPAPVVAESPPAHDEHCRHHDH